MVCMQHQSKEPWFGLAISRLGGLGTSLIIIEFGKAISSEFTKPQSLNEFGKIHNHARIYKDVYAWKDQLRNSSINHTLLCKINME